jgi:hypothetical protein
MMKGMGWPSALVALGFLGLTGFMFWRATENMDDFTAIWSVAGPIVGVVVVAIPATAFGARAHREQLNAQQRAEVYAAHMPDGSASEAEQVLTRRSKT